MDAGKARLTVAFQGERGAFSHEAALDVLGPGITLLPRPSFDAVFEAVVQGSADRAVVPIENSLAGSIHENYDRLQSRSLHIVGETQIRIRHCLIGIPGAVFESITRVFSQLPALDQCRNFFSAHPHIEAVATYDTAGAVRNVLNARVPNHAAIASRMAAELHGGTVMTEELEDDPQNFTRFLVLSRQAASIENATKTSIVFALENVPGALYHALGAFALRGVDLTKIESRPIRGRPWEYSFYLDAIGDPRGAAGEAVGDLKRVARDLRVLGSYPAGLKRDRSNESPAS
ncbi:MAG: prephenate dehydratase [Vicinamibacteria bacterium]|nr:prephenate dehydratase [Vicinamibacteria bacterium]